MPDDVKPAGRFLQIRLTDQQYRELEAEAFNMDRPISWVARNRMFSTGTAGTALENARPLKTVTSTKPKISNSEGHVSGTFPSPDPESWQKPEQETAIASDEATAVITRPADRLNAKAALTKTVRSTKPVGSGQGGSHRRPGEYSREEMADIDAERLARMKTGKRK